jgi:hypothetical protein
MALMSSWVAAGWRLGGDWVGERQPVADGPVEHGGNPGQGDHHGGQQGLAEVADLIGDAGEEPLLQVEA